VTPFDGNEVYHVLIMTSLVKKQLYHKLLSFSKYYYRFIQYTLEKMVTDASKLGPVLMMSSETSAW
jgi:hypothetical protein